LEFFYSQQMLFQTVKLQNLQEKIPRNYSGGGKISLKIGLVFKKFGAFQKVNRT